MGWLYGHLEMIRNEIGVNLNNKSKTCHPIWLIMDKECDPKLKSPLHMSDQLLNHLFVINEERILRMMEFS